MITTQPQHQSPSIHKLCSALVILLLATVAANAQWTTPDANQNISNTNSGNVGVKTTTPEFPLQVNNSSSII